MAAIISVVSGGVVVHTQRFESLNGEVDARIGAINGARYVLAEDGALASGVFAKRVGKNLLLEQRAELGEPSTLIIDHFFAHDAQLLGVGGEGDYLPYVAALATGSEHIADEGDYALLALASAESMAQVDAFQFKDAGAFVSTAVLSGLAAVAAGVVVSNAAGSNDRVPAPAVGASSVLKNAVASAAIDAPVAVVADAPATSEAVAELMTTPTLASPELHGSASASANDFASTPAHSEDATAALIASAQNAVSLDDSVPVIDAVIDDQGSIQGNVENGGYTDDGRLLFKGKAEAGALVHIYRNSELIGQVAAGANGQWSFTPRLPLADGRHVISILHEYQDGDVSAFSDPYVIFVDKSVPDAPLITGMVDDQGRITGAITHKTVTDDNRPTIDGSAEANATIIVYDKGSEIGRTKADADGNWRFIPEPPLADGTHILSYSAVDRAGNSSELSAATEFVVDTRPEKINIYYADDDVGAITGEVFNGGITDDRSPTLVGSATAGGIVSIYEGDVLLGQVTADVDGTWQFTPPTALSQGRHTFQATVTLVAKGESERSKAFNLDVVFNAPNVPSIDKVIDDVGAIQGVVENGKATDDATPTLSGKAEKGCTVSIFANGSLLGTALADANGKWVFTPAAPLAEGLQKFTITAADAAGNQSAPSAAYEILVDTLRPQAPKIVSVEDDVGEVQGPLQKGATTDDTQPTIKGTAEANSTVVISDNGSEIGRVQAGADGKWSFTPTLALSSGAHGITVIAVDSAGNASVPSDGFDFTVMVPPPVRASAPTIVSIYDDVGLVTGELKTGAVTDDTKPLIKGRGEPHATIVLKDNGVEIGRTQVNDSGDWSFLPTSALSFGLHNLIATTVDGAGNSSLPSNMFGFRVAAPGTGGALENFATADQWGVGETYVFPSGLVLEGTYYNGSVLSYYDGGGMRPEDRWNVLNRTGEKLVFSLPVESKKISFYHVANTGNSYARFLDVNGNIIGKITLIQNSGPEKVYFTAPAGKFVASIEVSSDIDANIAIGGLKWGERTPLDVTIAAAEADGFGGRYVWGKVLGIDTIPPGMALQITTDGGATWTNASVREGSWAASQKDMPAGEWVAEARVIELASGLSLGLTDTMSGRTTGGGAPKIERIPDALGSYTYEKAVDGSLIELSIKDTGAKQGDSVHIRWGTVTYDQVLTKADIESDRVTVKVPAEKTLAQGISYHFSVTAQIVPMGGGTGVRSNSYEVRSVYNVVDTRNPNIIDSKLKSFFGSERDDVVTINMNIAEYIRNGGAGIHGGDGIDTARITANQGTLAYTNGEKLTSMEIFEMVGNSSAFINLSDVLRNGGADIFYTGDKSRVQMLVKGTGGVILNDSLVGGTQLVLPDRSDTITGGDLGDWIQAKAVTIDGVKYNSYQHSLVAAEVLIKQGMGVVVRNRMGFTEAPDSKMAAAEFMETAGGLLQPAGNELFAGDARSTVDSAYSHHGVAGIGYSMQGFGADLMESHHALYAL